MDHTATDTPVTRHPRSVLSPVDKVSFLSAAVATANLSRDQIAVLVVITDMINGKSGECFPSYATVARRAAISDRSHAGRAIRALVDKGLLIRAKQGTRKTSSVYRLNAALVDKAQKQSTGLGQHRPHPEASTGLTLRPARASQSANKKSINLISQSESQRPTDELVASTIKRAEQFEDFWHAYGKRQQVTECEELLDRYLSEGHQLEAIVDGARRARLHAEHHNLQRRFSPLKWLQRKKWLDDWAIAEEPKPKRRKLL